MYGKPFKDLPIESHSLDYNASGFMKTVQLDLINLANGGKFHALYRRFIL